MNTNDNQKPTNIDINLNEETSSLSELDLLRLQLEKEKESKLRAIADYANQKKYFDKQLEEYSYISNKTILNQVIDLSDDLARTKEHSKENIKELNLFEERIKSIVSQYLEEIVCQIGDDFDPEIMEALATTPVDDKTLDGKVSYVAQKGYKLISNKRVVRPCRVIVGKQK